MKRPSLWLLLVLALLSPVSILACGDNEADEPLVTPPEITTTGLESTQWEVASINGTALSEDTYISLYFQNDGTFWGCITCNTYGGKYALSSDSLYFSDTMTTLVLCQIGDQAQADAYLHVFSITSSFKNKEKRLSFFDKDGKELVTLQQIPEYAMDPADLTGTKWRCVSINGEPVLSGLDITLYIDSDTASGRAGCFDYTLPYQANGDNVRWGISASRNGECSPEEELQAGEYTTAIAVAAQYILSPDKLEIFTARNDVLVFSALK